MHRVLPRSWSCHSAGAACRADGRDGRVPSWGWTGTVYMLCLEGIQPGQRRCDGGCLPVAGWSGSAAWGQRLWQTLPAGHSHDTLGRWEAAFRWQRAGWLQGTCLEAWGARLSGRASDACSSARLGAALEECQQGCRTPTEAIHVSPQQAKQFMPLAYSKTPFLSRAGANLVQTAGQVSHL